jgi:hypothetical protein
MNINAFIASAYAVFAAVLVWDYLAPRIRLARVRRDIALRGRRESARNARTSPTP